MHDFLTVRNAIVNVVRLHLQDRLMYVLRRKIRISVCTRDSIIDSVFVKFILIENESSVDKDLFVFFYFKLGSPPPFHGISVFFFKHKFIKLFTDKQFAGINAVVLNSCLSKLSRPNIKNQKKRTFIKSFSEERTFFNYIVLFPFYLFILCISCFIEKNT